MSAGVGRLVRAAVAAVPNVLIAVALVVLSLIGLCLAPARRRFVLQAMDRMLSLAAVLSPLDGSPPELHSETLPLAERRRRPAAVRHRRGDN